ncbi:right-handed parallel beta-helix repeat-containing protein, partial [Streptomyces scabiei]
MSAASGVRFEDNLFVGLGSSALGIGNDTNAALSGVGLGAQNIQVIGNRFTEVGGHGMFVGGNRPEAHHPDD